MATAMTLLWTVWAGFFLAVTALLVYRGLLTRSEDDHVFLDENILPNEQQRQKDIADRIHNLQPFVAFIGGGAVTVSATLLGIYLLNAIAVLRAG